MATTEANRAMVDPLSFSVSDVTGMHTLELEGVDGHRQVSDVALSVAELMDLPTNTTPYALRDESRAKMLTDDRPLGDQVEEGAKLVVIPKAILG